MSSSNMSHPVCLLDLIALDLRHALEEPQHIEAVRERSDVDLETLRSSLKQALQRLDAIFERRRAA